MQAISGPHVRAIGIEPVDDRELLSRWLAWLEASGRSRKTIDSYLRYALAFQVEHYRLTKRLVALQEITEEDIVGVLAAMPPKGHGRGLRLRALRSLYGWAFDADVPLVVHDPARRLRVNKPKEPPVPEFPDHVLSAFFEAAERVDPRARPTFEFMFGTGARLGSMVGVRVEDLHLDSPKGPHVHFEVAKNDAAYAIELEGGALAAAHRLLELRDYVPKRGTRAPNLIGVRSEQLRNWMNLTATLSPVRIRPHDLRRAFCTRIANDPEVPAFVVADLMNWRDTSPIRRYAVASRELRRRGLSNVWGLDSGPMRE